MRIASAWRSGPYLPEAGLEANRPRSRSVRHDGLVADSSLDGLRAAVAATRRVVAGVRAEQWTLPTPCPEWTAGELVDHVVSGNRLFAAALGGEVAPGQDDRLAAYDDSTEGLLTAFGAEDALERVVTVPFGTVPAAVALHLRVTELLVHGWDLAEASGQRLDVADEVAAQELAFSRQAIQQLPPGRSPFGPPQPAPDGAGPLDQLVALLGRRRPD